MQHRFSPSLAEPAAAGPATPLPLPWPGPGGIAFALLMAVAGGVLGIIGAFFQETRVSTAGILGPFLAAPVIEEALKPAGIYILQWKWPRLLPKQIYTASLSALGGLAFGLIESTVYVFVYARHHSHAYVLFRYTVDVALHGICSFIVGLGINQRLIDSANGDVPFLEGSRKYYITAIAIHASFNIAVTVLAVTHVWDIR